MSGKTRIIGFTAALALAALGGTASAEAATVGVSNGQLTYTAAAGETNSVTIANLGNSYDVRDAFTPVQAGPSCTRVTARRAICSRNATDHIFVNAFDGNDTVNILGEASRPAVVFGGTGNDVLSGTQVGDGLMGGPGDDQLDGRGGNDNLIGDDGRDVVLGGVGDDALSGNADDDSSSARTVTTACSAERAPTRSVGTPATTASTARRGTTSSTATPGTTGSRDATATTG